MSLSTTDPQPSPPLTTQLNMAAQDAVGCCRLVIKAANQKYEDIRIDCNLSWTVLDLKVHLSQHYPSKPKISDQRIIYSGHLLTDDQLMRNIVELSNDSANNTFTFHLVCPQQKQPAPASQQANNIDTGSTSNSIPTAIPPPSSSSSSSASSNMATGDASSQHHWDATMVNNLNNQLLMGPDNVLMQQFYNVLWRQYYQYMSYYLLQSPPIDLVSYAAFANSFDPNFAAANNNLSNPGVNQMAPTATGVPNQNNNNRVGENANLNVNDNGIVIGGGGNPNINIIVDDEMNRDWADIFFSITKAIVMISIIYFYSSLNRLVLFMAIFLIVYFYKNLFNGLQPNNGVGGPAVAANRNIRDERVRRPPDNNQQHEIGGEDGINDGQNQGQAVANLRHRRSDNNNNDVGQPDQNVPGAAPNGPYSGLRFVWVFISSLFTSLIPDPAPAMN